MTWGLAHLRNRDVCLQQLWLCSGDSWKATSPGHRNEGTRVGLQVPRLQGPQTCEIFSQLRLVAAVALAMLCLEDKGAWQAALAWRTQHQCSLLLIWSCSQRLRGSRHPMVLTGLWHFRGRGPLLYRPHDTFCFTSSLLSTAHAWKRKKEKPLSLSDVIIMELTHQASADP